MALEFREENGAASSIVLFLCLGRRIGQSRHGWLVSLDQSGDGRGRGPSDVTNTNHGELMSPPNKQSALLVPVGRPLFVCARKAVCWVGGGLVVYGGQLVMYANEAAKDVTRVIDIDMLPATPSNRSLLAEDSGTGTTQKATDARACYRLM